MGVDYDPGDEDDGAVKAHWAEVVRWHREARSRTMIPMESPDARESSVLYLAYTYRYSQPVYDHDSGDEDRRDIRPMKRARPHPFQTRSNPPRPVR